METVNPKSVLSMQSRLENSVTQVARETLPIAKKSRVFKNPFIDLRLLVLGQLLGVNGYMTMDPKVLISELRMKMADSFAMKELALAALTIVDAFQYNMMKKIPVTIPDTVVNFTINIMSKLVDMTTSGAYKANTHEVVYEAFYISALGNTIRDLDEVEYKFDSLSLNEKQKYVKLVIQNVFLVGSSFDVSQAIADKIGVGKSYSTFRTFYAIYKYSQYFSKHKTEITSSRFLNIITEKIKIGIMRLLGKFTGNRFYFIIRGLLDVVLGPLMLAIALDLSGQVGQQMNNHFMDRFK